MKLRSVRVENFKSINDSNDFSVGDLTCLVGKNESGKTALLQALQRLNPDSGPTRFADTEFPRNRWNEYKETKTDDPANVLTTVWELEAEDVSAVEAVLGPGALTSSTLRVTKAYDSAGSTWYFDIDQSVVIKNLLDSAGLFDEERKELEGVGSTYALTTKLKGLEAPSERHTKLLEKIRAFRNLSSSHAAVDALELPTFVYFADYDRLPGRVALAELSSREQAGTLTKPDRVFLALLSMVGTTADEIESIGTSEQLIAELEAVSVRLSNEIFNYWSQNRHLEVDFRYDAARPDDPAPFNSGYVFSTRVRNKRHSMTVNFDDRSAGFVWFFSFLVWFSQMKKNYGDNLFVLLDEPGLTLHARAQEDLLRYTKEKLVPNHQVMYSTHSPFMIDPADLLSARIVEDVVTKDDQPLGTKVREDVLATDQDTLFPLQAALGFDLTQTMFIGKNPLLVEGPSDLLYLRWASNELTAKGREGLDTRWTITPTGGIKKIGSFMALFAGNRLNVAVITDFHEGEKGHVRSLRESDILKSGHVLSVESYASQEEADVEDLLGRDLYLDVVADVYELKAKQRPPKKKPADASERVVKEVEEHFKTLPPEIREFDHFAPAVALVERAEQFRQSAGYHAALDRFEALFREVNKLLEGD